MCNDYLHKEASRGLKNWTQEGLSFLLQKPEFRDIAIKALSKFLLLNGRVTFSYNKLYYEIFLTSYSEYEINIYSTCSHSPYCKDKAIDGGICSGSAVDAIEFML